MKRVVLERWSVYQCLLAEGRQVEGVSNQLSLAPVYLHQYVVSRYLLTLKILKLIAFDVDHSMT